MRAICQILAIRQIIVQRNQRRKSPARTARSGQNTGKLTAAALIRSYESEAQRQKLLVKKADLAQTRLTFIVNALRRLCSVALGHFADQEGARYGQAGDALQAHRRLDRRGWHRRTLGRRAAPGAHRTLYAGRRQPIDSLVVGE